MGDEYEQAANYIVKMSTDMLTESIPSNRTMSMIGEIALENDASMPADVSEHEFSAESYVFEDVSNAPSTLDYDWVSDAVLDDATLVPLDNLPLLKNVTRRIDFRVDQVYYEGIGSRIGIGMQPYTAPKVPSLLSAFTTGELAFDESTYGPGSNPYVVEHLDIVEIYMENPQPWPHPMHLHVSDI